MILLGTAPVQAHIEYTGDELNISCLFKYTLHQSCLVQVIESETGFYDALFLDDEESESAHHTLIGLPSGTYTILIHGVGAEDSSLANRPDYFTVIKLPTTSLEETSIEFFFYACLHAYITDFSISLCM